MIYRIPNSIDIDMIYRIPNSIDIDISIKRHICSHTNHTDMSLQKPTLSIYVFGFFLLQDEHECDIKKNRAVRSTNVATVELSVAVLIHYYKLYPVSYREVEFQFKKDKIKTGINGVNCDLQDQEQDQDMVYCLLF